MHQQNTVCLFFKLPTTVVLFPKNQKPHYWKLRKIPQMNNVKRFNVSLRGHEQMFLVQLLLRRLSNCQIIKWL